MNWNQPCCEFCWLLRSPHREPVRLLNAMQEKCAWCGQPTKSGIYVRAHPSSVAHPAPEDDE